MIRFLSYSFVLFFPLKEIDICNCEWYSSLCLRFKSEHSVRKIEHNSELPNAWFEISYMKMNTGKCYLLSSGCKHEHMRAKIGHDMIWESNIVKQLRVTIYNHLIFDNYVISSIAIDVIRTVLFFLLKYFAQKNPHKLYSNILIHLKKHNKQHKQLSFRYKAMNLLLKYRLKKI